MKKLIASLAGVCLFITPTLLKAQLNINATIGGVPNFGGATLLNFDGALPSNLTLNNAYQVSGFNGSVIYVQPYFSGTTASYFGETPSSGADGTPYIAVYGGGTATFTFSTPQSNFGLLWGSIGTSDSLSFYNSANSLIGVASPTNFLASTADFGSWGADGTYYVDVNSSTPFSKVVATTASNCFELDDVAYATPEPATCALAAVGLGVLGFVRRK